MGLFGEISHAALEQDPSVIFGLDSSLRIVYCNAAWDHFASSNGGSGLARPAPIGRPLLDSISGPLAAFYQCAYRNVLRTGEPWRHLYECSSPATFRQFAMHVFPMKKARGLLVVNSLCVERPHEPSYEHAGELQYRHAGGIIVMCSHCRRIQRADASGRWDWVAAYVEHQPTNTSHGLCALCLEYYYPGIATRDPDPA